MRRKFARVLCVRHMKLKHLAQLWPSSGLGAKKKLDMSLDFPNLVEVTSDIPKKSRGEIRESFVRQAHMILLSKHLIASPGPRLARLWRAMATTMDNDANDGEMDDDIYIYIQYMQSLLFKCGEEGKANHQPEKKQTRNKNNKQTEQTQTNKRHTHTRAHTHTSIYTL